MSDANIRVQARLQALAKDFLIELPLRLQSIATHLEDENGSSKGESLDAAILDLHKIAGTAGTFGFNGVGDECKALEVQLKVYRDSKNTQDFSVYIDGIHRLIEDAQALQDIE